MRRKRARTTTSLLNEKPIGAWFDPQRRPVPQRAIFRESRCHACCKSPYGCARNYVCDCHRITEPQTVRGLTPGFTAIDEHDNPKENR